jgi:hypothetical protein
MRQNLVITEKLDVENLTLSTEKLSENLKLTEKRTKLFQQLAPNYQLKKNNY